MAAIYLINDQTPEALGITSMVRERRNLDNDLVRLGFDKAIDLDSVFEHEDDVIIKQDGNVWFHGTAQPTAHVGTARDEVKYLDIMGPWWKLSRFVYPHIDPNAATPGSVRAGDEEYSTRRVMYVDGATDEAMSTQEAMEELLDYADSKNLLTVGSGLNLLGDLYPMRETMSNKTLAEVIRSIMRYHVDIGIYWTYGIGAPTINFKQRGSAPLSYAVGTPPLQQISPMVLRRDLAPSGVFIRYERSLDGDGVLSSAGYRSREGADKYPSDADPDEENIMVATVQLGKAEPVPVGVAERYYKMFNDPPIVEGTLTFQAEDCTTGIKPGDTINITGAAPELVDEDCLVQSVVEDAFTGRTTVRLGMPRHMALQSMLDVVKEVDYQREPDPVEVALPESQGPLCGYCERVGTNVVFRISQGVISTGESETTDNVPKWEFTSTLLSAASPPGVTVAEGSAFDYYLYAEVNPVPETFTMLDADGDAVVEKQGIGPCDAVDLRMVFSPTAMGSPRAPELDPETGDVVQTGRYYFLFGSFAWPVGGSPTVNPTRLGGYYLLHVPPNRLVLVPS
jgi:hypothetical protein